MLSENAFTRWTGNRCAQFSTIFFIIEMRALFFVPSLQQLRKTLGPIAKWHASSPLGAIPSLQPNINATLKSLFLQSREYQVVSSASQADNISSLDLQLPAHCTGCGVELQNEEPQSPG